MQTMQKMSKWESQLLPSYVVHREVISYLIQCLLFVGLLVLRLRQIAELFKK